MWLVLHKDEHNRQECISIHVEADAALKKGLHSVRKQIETTYKNTVKTIEITFDIKIK